MVLIGTILQRPSLKAASDRNPERVCFVVFGLLALSQPNPFFEFFRIFLTWVNRVLEIFLYLRIQVEINIATGRREQWAEVLGPEKRKSIMRRWRHRRSCRVWGVASCELIKHLTIPRYRLVCLRLFK